MTATTSRADRSTIHRRAKAFAGCLLAVLTAGATVAAAPAPEHSDGRSVAGPFGFDDGLGTWSVSNDSPMSMTGTEGMTWLPTADGLDGTAGMAVTPYHDQIDTTLVSPLIDGDAPVVVEWWERFEVEGLDWDPFEVSWVADDGTTGLIRTTAAGSHGGVGQSQDWPDWNRVRLAVDTAGRDFRLRFRLSSDENCSSSCSVGRVVDTSYLGVWLDDVVVWHADAVGELQHSGRIDIEVPDGRVFPEPVDAGPADEVDRGVWWQGSRALEQRHPGLVQTGTVREFLGGDDNARSPGNDDLVPWDPQDSDDGRDFRVVILTDESIPASQKEHLILSVAHGAESCGYEGWARWAEDLLRDYEEHPDRVVDAGTRDGEPVGLTVRELLQRVRIVLVELSPDGWWISQQNGAGFNTNRIAVETGWVIPQDDVINGYGYSTLTQPAGGAVTTWLRSLRDDVQGGRPIAAALDMHGPQPTGMLLDHTRGASVGAPARTREMAERMTERTLTVLAHSDVEAIRTAYDLAVSEVDRTHHKVVQTGFDLLGDLGELNKIAWAPTHWNQYATPFDLVDYDAANSWGAYYASEAGLAADAFTHELPCRNIGRPTPAEMQLYVDNVRAILDVVAVHAAERFGLGTDSFDAGSPIGFVPNPTRVSRGAHGDTGDAPYPGTPFHPTLEQVPYDVASTDWFVDARSISTQPIVELHGRGDRGRSADAGIGHRPDRGAHQEELAGIGTVAVADHTAVDVAALRSFAEDGGNVVLTDRAVTLAQDILDTNLDVDRRFGYVGWSEVDRDHPWAADHEPLWNQTYAPTALGFPLLLERDQYWIACMACSEPTGPTTYTQNSAPHWTIDRSAWEAAGGTTIGTVDPPEDRKGTHDGTSTDRVTIGTVPVGAGRLVVLGALLPQPSADDYHPLGLAAYALTPMGHDLLVDALTWERPQPS